MRKEESPSQASEDYRSLAETIPQMVWAARADGFLEYFNRRSLEYTGLTVEQSQGTGWTTVLSRAEAPWSGSCLARS